jgi:hypothetical protein
MRWVGMRWVGDEVEGMRWVGMRWTGMRWVFPIFFVNLYGNIYLGKCQL